MAYPGFALELLELPASNSSYVHRSILSEKIRTCIDEHLGHFTEIDIQNLELPIEWGEAEPPHWPLLSSHGPPCLRKSCLFPGLFLSYFVGVSGTPRKSQKEGQEDQETTSKAQGGIPPRSFASPWCFKKERLGFPYRQPRNIHLNLALGPF